MMATTKNGLMGGVSGLIGNVVGVSRNGSFYFRSRPAHVKNPNTKKQATQRSKFSVTMSFLKTFSPVLRIGFRSDAAGMKSAFNAAMSYNMQHAMKEEDSGFDIDFQNILVSKGKLPKSVIVETFIAEGSLCVRWDDTHVEKARYNEEVMMLAYNPARKSAIYDLYSGKRDNQESYLPLPSLWQGDTVEAYIAFLSADASEVSDSQYTGRHKVTV